MTESEWLGCTDPYLMLWHLKGKDSDRKMRLFVAACCRRVWYRLTDHRSRAAIEVAERYVDGQISDREREEARQGAKAAKLDSKRGSDGDSAWALRGELVALAVSDNVRASLLIWLFNETAQNMNPTGETNEKEAQAKLLRDLLGNPFRSLAVAPSWAAWNDGAIRKLAQSIYDAHAFDRLPLLADALEDAGCTDAEILSHCRNGGEHVRGCWVVDLLLGKS